MTFGFILPGGASWEYVALGDGTFLAISQSGWVFFWKLIILL